MSTSWDTRWVQVSRGLGMVLRQSVGTAVVGLAVGLGVAWAASRLLDAFLFGVQPRYPLTFAGGAALLLAVVLLASFVPARRATTVDPMEVLKTE